MTIKCHLNIVVCDDIVKEREQIADMAGDILKNANIRYDISKFENAKALLNAIQNGEQYNILLLDVMMDEMDGMELAKYLRGQQNKADIIFISTNREMALCGYEVNAVRYLAKPVEPDKLKEALLYCLNRWSVQKEILLPTTKGQYRTSFSEIQFVEAFERGTKFVLSKGIVETKLKFSEVKSMLPESVFIHCHRAYIVNIICVMRIRPFEFDLHSGLRVPISKNRYYEINRKFIELISD